MTRVADMTPEMQKALWLHPTGDPEDDVLLAENGTGRPGPDYMGNICRSTRARKLLESYPYLEELPRQIAVLNHALTMENSWMNKPTARYIREHLDPYLLADLGTDVLGGPLTLEYGYPRELQFARDVLLKLLESK